MILLSLISLTMIHQVFLSLEVTLCKWRFSHLLQITKASFLEYVALPLIYLHFARMI